MAPTPDILLDTTDRLVAHMRERLQAQGVRNRLLKSYANATGSTSAVLFTLGRYRMAGRKSAEPCFIFCERSARVRQPGDLCFPGGGVMPRFDALYARLLRIPGTPLSRWPDWSWWWRHHRTVARQMALFLATSLRESFEEMRLNPFGLCLLGPLIPEHLALFQQVIFPVAAWVNREQRFSLNAEVAQVIPMALKDFFDPSHFACLRIRNETGAGVLARDFRCFQPPLSNGTVPLWGATLRMVIRFLQVVFDFHPPPLATLPVIHGLLHRSYATGGMPPASHGNGLIIQE
jgi:hypothetical protein